MAHVLWMSKKWVHVTLQKGRSEGAEVGEGDGIISGWSASCLCNGGARKFALGPTM